FLTVAAAPLAVETTALPRLLAVSFTFPAACDRVAVTPLPLLICLPRMGRVVVTTWLYLPCALHVVNATRAGPTDAVDGIRPRCHPEAMPAASLRRAAGLAFDAVAAARPPLPTAPASSVPRPAPGCEWRGT